MTSGIQLMRSIVLQSQTNVRTIGQSIRAMIDKAIQVLPGIIAALLVLVVGLIVGRIVGGAVSKILSRIGLGKYLQRGPVSDGEGMIKAIGDLVKYFIYYLAFVAAINILQIRILTRLMSDIGGYLPTIIGAAAVVVIGLVIAHVLENIIADLVDGFGVDDFLDDTPLSGIAAERGVGRLTGQVVAMYVYFLTALAAANVLQIPILTRLLSRITRYIPEFVGGLLVLIVGIWLGGWIGGLIAGTDGSRLTDVFGVGMKVLVYYFALTIALQTAGFNTRILREFFYVVAVAFFGAIAIAFVLAFGIGGAFGTREFISEHIDDWYSGAKETVDEMNLGEATAAGAGSGEVNTDTMTDMDEDIEGTEDVDDTDTFDMDSDDTNDSDPFDMESEDTDEDPDDSGFGTPSNTDD